MKVYGNVLEMVGRTPMLEVSKLDTGCCALFLKLELLNPAGSIKDRIGKRTAFVSKQLGLKQGFRQGSPIDRHKRCCITCTVGMNGSGNKFFTGSTFPLEKHGALSLGDSSDGLIYGYNGWTAPHQRL
jgi:hypothetical protein